MVWYIKRFHSNALLKIWLDKNFNLKTEVGAGLVPAL